MRFLWVIKAPGFYTHRKHCNWEAFQKIPQRSRWEHKYPNSLSGHYTVFMLPVPQEQVCVMYNWSHVRIVQETVQRIHSDQVGVMSPAVCTVCFSRENTSDARSPAVCNMWQRATGDGAKLWFSWGCTPVPELSLRVSKSSKKCWINKTYFNL